MRNLIAIALGGALGSLCRYGVHHGCTRALGAHAAWGTLSVNVVGCFLIGLLAASTLGQHGSVSHAALAIGFLGGFTTFSTFGLDAIQLIEAGRAGMALAYAAGSVLVGVAAAFTGLLAGRGLWN